MFSDSRLFLSRWLSPPTPQPPPPSMSPSFLAPCEAELTCVRSPCALLALVSRTLQEAADHLELPYNGCMHTFKIYFLFFLFIFLFAPFRGDLKSGLELLFLFFFGGWGGRTDSPKRRSGSSHVGAQVSVMCIFRHTTCIKRMRVRQFSSITIYFLFCPWRGCRCGIIFKIQRVYYHSRETIFQ